LITRDIDTYLLEGCGRCPLGGTPQCKVNTWREELEFLRRIVLECGLIEEMKWGVPCYTHKNKNVLLVSAFKEFCSLSFFKGALLKDEHGILKKPGENSQAARIIKFTSPHQVAGLEAILKAYIYEAVEIEKAGLKVKMKKSSEFNIPQEFKDKLNQSPSLEAAFKALTPGRQRGYLLHFSQPKQSKTRVSRIEKCIPKIMEGKGFHDR